MHSFLLLYSWFIRLILVWLPDAPIVMRARGALYSLGMQDVGKNFQVSGSVIIKNLRNMSIGDNVYLSPGVIINAIGPISLGDEVMIGFNSVLVSGNHVKMDNSYRFSKSVPKEIVILSGAWVAANCTVLGGAKIGKCCVLAANSCTSKELEDCATYGGVPARRVKKND